MNYYILSLFNIILGTLISISASSWLMAWLGLELNLMSFMPWLKSKNNPFSMESSMKYFLIQATASSLFILMSIYQPYFNFSMTSYSWIMFFILAMKMAMAPLHFWLIPLVDSMSWISLMMIMTWQKIAPIFIIIMLPQISITFILLSLLLGPILMINQTSLKKLMTFSSISHLGWISISSLYSKFMTISYFLLYMMSSLIIMLMLLKFKISWINQMYLMPKTLYYIFSLNILSLSGFPPFAMFFPKIMIIFSTLNSSSPLAIILILSSLLSLYSYIRITWSMNLHPLKFSKMSFNYNKINTMKQNMHLYLMMMIPLSTPLILISIF